MPRKLSNFIDGFIAYMEDKGSPRIYAKWSAIFTVSAAIERKVWVNNRRGPLHPGQFILLVGPAGVGKSVCTNVVYDLLDTIRKGRKPLHIAPSSVTKASLIDGLAKAERSIIRPLDTPSITSFNSLTVIANEFGVFLPSWEGDFMSVLTDIWDGKRYAETRRTAKIDIELPNTQINLLSATTPAYLMKLLPEGAWEEGFMSRMLIVYSGETRHVDLFGDETHDDKLWTELTHDIDQIYSMFGEMKPTEEFVEAFNIWGRSGGAPRPDHPKLAGYCTRRSAHLLKLCTVAAAATDSELTLTVDHFAEALDWLVELETYMTDVFKALKGGGDSRAMEECWHMGYQYFMKHNKPVPEHIMYTFLQERIPAHSVERVIDVMVRGRLFTKKFMDDGSQGYEPRVKS